MAYTNKLEYHPHHHTTHCPATNRQVRKAARTQSLPTPQQPTINQTGWGDRRRVVGVALTMSASLRPRGSRPPDPPARAWLSSTGVRACPARTARRSLRKTVHPKRGNATVACSSAPMASSRPHTSTPPPWICSYGATVSSRRPKPVWIEWPWLPCQQTGVDALSTPQPLVPSARPCSASVRGTMDST